VVSRYDGVRFALSNRCVPIIYVAFRNFLNVYSASFF